jgi:general secretion pathway protein N
VNIRAARLTTRTLAGICAGLLLLAILQYAGVGRGHHWLPEPEAPERLALGQVDREPFKMPPAATFAEVERRPLFNTDRKPTPLDQAEGEDATAEEAPPPSPLNVALTGIIISSETDPPTRIALIRDNSRNQSLALKVGMPLEGQQGAWTLTEIHERSVEFTSLADEVSEVELETGPAPAQRPPPRGSRDNANRNQANDEKSDLAERIEQRRQQMRERAEQLREQREAGQRKPKEN